MTVIGTHLSGRFRLEERVGSGGMSTVYRAFDETLERLVAIKLLHSDMSSDPDQLERFHREARAVARLSHPHVVTVIDAGEDAGNPYIVLEYVEGETLKERIRRVGRLSGAEAVAYAVEIGRALDAAHAARLVHRDVKPQNVLIDCHGRAKVTDFGIVRSLENEGLTADGRVLGTTDYVSPEQALGEPVNEQSDLYSLGVCLYEMLTGEVPYKAETPVAVAMKHVREPMPDVRLSRPDLSAALGAVVERATAKERENRYATATEMLADLEQALVIEVARAGEATGEATAVLRALPGATADAVPLRLRRPGRVLGLSLLAVALVGAVVWWGVSRAREGTTGGVAPKGSGRLAAVRLASDAVNDYDPPPAGDGNEHGEDVRNAIDGNPTTFWDTENYSAGGGLGKKPGVGLYVEADAAVAASRLDVVTRFPGWDAQVYASDSVPATIDGWTRIGGTTTIGETGRISLDSAGRPFRYYLLWIVKLPAGGKASIAELTLLR